MSADDFEKPMWVCVTCPCCRDMFSTQVLTYDGVSGLIEDAKALAAIAMRVDGSNRNSDENALINKYLGVSDGLEN